MPSLTGSATALFLFDVGDAVDLGQAARFRTLDGEEAGTPEVAGFRVRFTVFDYGVVSVSLTRALPAGWDTLLTEGREWYAATTLAVEAERLCRALLLTFGDAVKQPRATFLMEDYWIFAVTQADDSRSGEEMLALHGAEIAQLLRGEREPLSGQERDEVLRHRLSYLANDLVIPTWNGAFVYDTEAGARETLDMLEYANSQLLQFRYYDDLLDAALAKIYGQLEHGGWLQSLFGRRYAQAAREVQSVYIDVTELTDKAEHALKFAGDVYAARLFSLAAARMGLNEWKGNVQEKLKTLDSIYRFAVEQTSMTRGELLELTVVLILLLELGLFLAGIME
jgi:hypothetical protein